MEYKVVIKKNDDYQVSSRLHSVFFEFFGRAIYDGVWVGKDSEIPNIDGIRLDVIEGLREMKVGAMRWPGGCFADHYHWKNGIGPKRYHKYCPLNAGTSDHLWRNDFGTDEFLRFCELTGAEPVLTINTATGTPEEFLDWYEYVNGDVNTKYGQLRAENGHAEPYNVTCWGVGNTDENVWHIDYNNPVAYAQTYLKYTTVVQESKKDLYFIGLGLSMRHKLPGWTGKMLDHVTRNQRDIAPNALSVHHYLGGAKAGGELCGEALEYTDEGYYAVLELLERYQYDIDLHRITIREHTKKNSHTKICFDEWGVWHPEATGERGLNQRQSMRDAIFAALTLHIFYRNSDIVEFAMETQLSNVLQSLFETDGEKFYKTPTFYVMKLFREHMGQYVVPVLPYDLDRDLDIVATISEDETKLTISIVNRHLYEERDIKLSLSGAEWRTSFADIVTAEEVRMCNSFEHPTQICDEPFEVENVSNFTIPAHSIVRLCVEKRGETEC